jgi:hypothetical protein
LSYLHVDDAGAIAETSLIFQKDKRYKQRLLVCWKSEAYSLINRCNYRIALLIGLQM